MLIDRSHILDLVFNRYYECLWDEIPFHIIAVMTTVLSPRELAVLQLLCDGLSNREIAGSLHISVNTAREHVSSVIRKMNVRNRTACAAEGIRRHLVR